ncbi:unnamed protein product [Schistosoma curassoni]|uniref:Uncharacterized protein n=1 Tax=Schistosoma curassoni TaxID=6186 RepID=A0A183KLY0_9TREM|nr:unnamed protein product [Schistosoma curassoni]
MKGHLQDIELKLTAVRAVDSQLHIRFCHHHTCCLHNNTKHLNQMIYFALVTCPL